MKYISMLIVGLVYLMPIQASEERAWQQCLDVADCISGFTKTCLVGGVEIITAKCFRKPGLKQKIDQADLFEEDNLQARKIQNEQAVILEAATLALHTDYD